MVRYQHTFVDDDAADVPIRDAATVMIVRDDPQFEVLMVQRASRASFGASAWVFPGGRVDSADLNPSQPLANGRTGNNDSENSGGEWPILDVEIAGEKGGAAWRTAAVRETLEEAGILLAAGDGALHDNELASMRHALLHRGATLSAELGKRSIELDLSNIHEVGRFITPMGPPRRFDTWFYLTPAPAGQVVTPDGSEIVNARWVSPVLALELWASEEFPLMGVTHRMLACLRRYHSVAEVIEHASLVPELRRVRVNDPDGRYEVLLPEDPGYETADLEVEHGWVRL